VSETEIADFRPFMGQKDIRRFQIAMDDAVPVRVVECRQYFLRDTQQVRNCNRSSDKTVRERLTFDVFKDKKVAVLRVSHIQKGADVRVVEPGDRVRLAIESGADLAMVRVA